MINIGHNLVRPNLPEGQELTGINLKKVTGQSKFVYLVPSMKLDDATIPADYYVSII